MSKSLTGILSAMIPKLLKGSLSAADLAPVLEFTEPHLIAWMQRLTDANLQDGEDHLALNTILSESGEFVTYVVTIGADGRIIRRLGEPYTLRNLATRIPNPPQQKTLKPKP